MGGVACVLWLLQIFNVYGEENRGTFAADEIKELCLTILSLRRLCRDNLWTIPDEDIVNTMLERMGFTELATRSVDCVRFVPSLCRVFVRLHLLGPARFESPAAVLAYNEPCASSSPPLLCVRA